MSKQITVQPVKPKIEHSFNQLGLDALRGNLNSYFDQFACNHMDSEDMESLSNSLSKINSAVQADYKALVKYEKDLAAFQKWEESEAKRIQAELLAEEQAAEAAEDARISGLSDMALTVETLETPKGTSLYSKLLTAMKGRVK
ncbi:hypothetical protein EOPP23_16945 [Endozoicomonas sp. OPT23]|uniref:hypothetical protein n=1 Tax=Endozoicomonas sp. OPT23 TaxID=2072845 RepID=UPI00129A98EF|nr:hypothetical protein [Endozoicomonas sp. OPT23]MRI34673.1 hypothetical protein [Endozoicomonas sp. OPT23]